MKDEHKLMMDVVNLANVDSTNSKDTDDGMRSVCCRLMLSTFDFVHYVWAH